MVRVEGMKIENKVRAGRNDSPAYYEDNFERSAFIIENYSHDLIHAGD